MNYVVNKQIGRVGRRLVVLFIDLRAVFDSVDREGVDRNDEEKRDKGGTCKKDGRGVKENKEQGESEWGIGVGFWTARGMRQGCPLSLVLFNILILDIEEDLVRVRWGGVRIRGKRMYTLAYADDMVIMAEEEK